MANPWSRSAERRGLMSPTDNELTYDYAHEEGSFSTIPGNTSGDSAHDSAIPS